MLKIFIALSTYNRKKITSLCLENLKNIVDNDGSALLSIYDINQVISILNRGKELFGIPNSKIDIGSNADFTLFEPTSIKTVSNEDTKSTSKNNIFVGYKTIGSVYGIISNEKIVLNS